METTSGGTRYFLSTGGVNHTHLQPPSLEILLKIKNVAPFGPTNEENVVFLSSLTSIIVAIEFVSGLSNRVLQKVT